MASIIPFDNAVIDSTSIAAPAFQVGTGTLQIESQDIATTTADGRIHNDRIAQNYSASFSAYGDQRSLDTANGLGVSVSIKQDETVITTFTGLVSAEYNSSSNVTQVSISGDPA